ncbi:MAG: hypothetical protein K2Y08_04385 [Alphaproteobacteria bacterium]|nr:hypothetical protein [Alphaproteobacteria bacterium]
MITIDRIKNIGKCSFFIIQTMGMFCLHQNNLYAVFTHYEEDYRHYTISASSKEVTPLISFSSQTAEYTDDINDIKTGQKAAITVCTTPLGPYINHVSLVFELIIKPHSTQEAVFHTVGGKEITSHLNLFNLHFGGDGDSIVTDKKRPSVDNVRDTLRKVHRAQKLSITAAQPEEVPPMYTRRVVFLVDQIKAQRALEEAEKEEGLVYRTLPIWHNWDNCCTYASRVLRRMGIGVNSWYAENFVHACSNCHLPEGIKRYFPNGNGETARSLTPQHRECIIL